jgi:hypothetical protein
MDEDPSERFGGKFPLSKIGGQQLKDLTPEVKKEYVDLFRPPGIVEKYDTNLGVKSQIDERIWLTMPTAKLYRRGKPEDKKEEYTKYDRFGIGGLGD